MAVDSDFQGFVVDQLSTIPVVPRRMFGGVGFFVDGLMFALIGRSEALFFKTDESNVAEYEALGGEPFTYSRGEKKSSMGYHTVPAEILDDGEELTAWAEKAIAVARRAAASKPKARTRNKAVAKSKRPKRKAGAKKRT
jgi:DNA transformation protein and related proteins